MVVTSEAMGCQSIYCRPLLDLLLIHPRYLSYSMNSHISGSIPNMYPNAGTPFRSERLPPRPTSSVYSNDTLVNPPTPPIQPQPLGSLQSPEALDRWLDKLLDTLADRYTERQSLKGAWTASEDKIRQLKYQLYTSGGVRMPVQQLLDSENEYFLDLENRLHDLKEELDDLLAVFWRLLEERSKGKTSPVEKVCAMVQALGVEDLERVKEVVQEGLYKKGNFF